MRLKDPQNFWSFTGLGSVDKRTNHLYKTTSSSSKMTSTRLVVVQLKSACGRTDRPILKRVIIMTGIKEKTVVGGLPGAITCATTMHPGLVAGRKTGLTQPE